jgi:hypothetical protein
MGLRMECMCLQCGISHYVPLDDISMEVIADFEYPLVVNMFCNKCGGMLFVVGKEGDQPRYVTG